MFGIRLIISITIVIIILATVITGGPLLLTSLALISCIGLFELYRIQGIHKTFLAIIGYVSSLFYYYLVYINWTNDFIKILVFSVLLFMACYVITYPKFKTEQILISIFGLIYVPLMLSYIYQVRTLTNGIYLVWLIFIGAWGSDTCAYLVGILIGKHQSSLITVCSVAQWFVDPGAFFSRCYEAPIGRAHV